MGASAWEGTEPNFHGVKMYWSHYNNIKNRKLIEKAGFAIILDQIDDSVGEKHQVLLAKKL